MVSWLIRVLVLAAAVALTVSCETKTARDPEEIEPTERAALHEATAIVLSFHAEYGELPDAEHGQHLITEWKDIRDGWGQNLRYTVLGDKRFEIRSSGPDAVFDTVDDLMDMPSVAPRKAAQPRPQAKEKEEKKATVDPQLQADRKALIEKMIRNDIFAKVEPGYSVPKIWVGSQFYLLTFEDKQSFVSVVYAYYFPDGGGMGDVVQLKDNMTGKVIGDFSRQQGGLRLK